MDPALEAVEDAFHAVFVAITQHRLLQRQPLLPRIGDKRLPAETLAMIGNGVLLASDAGDVVAGFLDHPLLAVHSASTSTHVLGGLLDLLFPGYAEQPVHPLVLKHTVNRFYERRFVGDLPFPPPARGCQGREGCLRMVQTFFQPRCLLGGMQRGTDHQHPFAPCHVAVRRTTGPLKLIALGSKYLMPPLIGAPYP